jgi:hypothetical protein
MGGNGGGWTGGGTDPPPTPTGVGSGTVATVTGANALWNHGPACAGSASNFREISVTEEVFGQTVIMPSRGVRRSGGTTCTMAFGEYLTMARISKLLGDLHRRLAGPGWHAHVFVGMHEVQGRPALPTMPTKTRACYPGPARPRWRSPRSFLKDPASTHPEDLAPRQCGMPACARFVRGSGGGTPCGPRPHRVP